VVVLTHVKPDGDALGSTLAVTRAINLAAGDRASQPVAVPWYWGPLPDWAPGVLKSTTYRAITEENRADHDNREDPDAIIILDTGSWSQLHEVREWLLARNDIATVIDHHRQGNADVAPRRVIQVQAAAVCEPAADLCRRVLGLKAGAQLPTEVAEPLYLGLATDTGWFRHSNVSPTALRLAAELLEAGVDHAKLYEMVEQRDRVSRLRLMSRALNSLEMHHGDKVAVMTLLLKDFEECRAAATDSAGFSEIPLAAEKVKVSVLITEAFRTEGADNQQITKVSFRAKSGPGASMWERSRPASAAAVTSPRQAPSSRARYLKPSAAWSRLSSDDAPAISAVQAAAASGLYDHAVGIPKSALRLAQRLDPGQQGVCGGDPELGHLAVAPEVHARERPGRRSDVRQRDHARCRTRLETPRTRIRPDTRPTRHLQGRCTEAPPGE
jgi:phosphoesterase RecJ-like protein